MTELQTRTKYTYDAGGRRVRKNVSAGIEDYVYDLSGRQIAVFNSTGGWIRGEVYAGARHFATYINDTTYFIQADHLGTERVRSHLSGAGCEFTSSLPFGDGQSTTGSCGDPSPLHFTGKERDTESNLDNFGARYNSSSIGRFMSPDWAAKPTSVPYAAYGNPQSLNLYAYVENNPVTSRDADGHWCLWWGIGTTCNLAPPPPPPPDPANIHAGPAPKMNPPAQNQPPAPAPNPTPTPNPTPKSEPNPVVTAVSDYMGVGAAVSKNTPLGIASSLLSIANDRSRLNVELTVVSSVLPYVVEGSDVPIAFGFAAYDGSQFAGQVMTGVFTPDALQSDTISNGYGQLIPNPQAAFDQAFGPNY